MNSTNTLAAIEQHLKELECAPKAVWSGWRTSVAYFFNLLFFPINLALVCIPALCWGMAFDMFGVTKGTLLAAGSISAIFASLWVVAPWLSRKSSAYCSQWDDILWHSEIMIKNDPKQAELARTIANLIGNPQVTHQWAKKLNGLLRQLCDEYSQQNNQASHLKRINALKGATTSKITAYDTIAITDKELADDTLTLSSSTRVFEDRHV